jgi:hypothetical protein
MGSLQGKEKMKELEEIIKEIIDTSHRLYNENDGETKADYNKFLISLSKRIVKTVLEYKEK